jgi:hypothetical protein
MKYKSDSQQVMMHYHWGISLLLHQLLLVFLPSFLVLLTILASAHLGSAAGIQFWQDQILYKLWYS